MASAKNVQAIMLNQAKNAAAQAPPVPKGAPKPVAENPNSAAMAAMPNATAAKPYTGPAFQGGTPQGVAPMGMPTAVAAQQQLTLPTPPPVTTPTFGAPSPTAGGAVSNTPRPGAPPRSPDLLDSTYNDIMSSMDKNWQGQQQMLQNQATNNQRLAGINNARAGRNSLGGGAAMLNAQAMVGSQNEMAKAGIANSEQRQGLMMDFLGKRLDQQYRKEDRANQVSDQNDLFAHQTNMLNSELAGGVPGAGSGLPPPVNSVWDPVTQTYKAKGK